VHLQFSPVNLAQNIFLRPGSGARAPSAPPGYVCVLHSDISVVVFVQPSGVRNATNVPIRFGHRHTARNCRPTLSVDKLNIGRPRRSLF